VNEQVDINVIMSTGIYTFHYLPYHITMRPPKSVADDILTRMFLRDLTVGIGDSGIRAQSIKVANDAVGFTPNNVRVLRATGRASAQTGAPITAHVTGVDRVDRSGHAAAFGVSETATVSADRWAAQLTDGGRPNLIVEAIGHQVATLRLCFEAAAFGGQVFYFGVPDDLTYPMEMRTFFRKNLTLRAGWTMDRRRVLQEAAGYLAAHEDLRDAYVSHVFAASEVQRAFEAAIAPRPGQFKIVIDMTA